MKYLFEKYLLFLHFLNKLVIFIICYIFFWPLTVSNLLLISLISVNYFDESYLFQCLSRHITRKVVIFCWIFATRNSLKSFFKYFSSANVYFLANNFYLSSNDGQDYPKFCILKMTKYLTSMSKFGVLLSILKMVCTDEIRSKYFEAGL